MNETKVLGISGKKQSGKNTAANYIVGVFLKALRITNDFSINQSGQLIVSDIFGDEKHQGIMDLDSRNPVFLEFAEENIYPFVKCYSYADLLKQHVCMDILGLTWEQCYGTDEQKMTPTHLKWEDMPGVTDVDVFTHGYADISCKTFGFIYHKPGPMTARDVMQFIGTEIFRKMYGNVWVDATLRKIKQDAPTMALITDCRFPNEVNGILKASDELSGRVARLGRDIFKGQDQHESETSLDDFPIEKYSLYLDNNNMSIAEQNQAIYNFLAEEKWLPHEVPTELLERLPS